jgi:multidrug transporter EmrE-like cation transporter
MAAISLWSASGICALFALGVYFFADSLGSVLIALFAAGWITALALFLRTPSHD